jgi:myo-inositol catabolism protein IolC
MEDEKMDDPESTLQHLENIGQLHMFMKQDIFSLLIMYHEDDPASVKALQQIKKVEKKLRGYAHFLAIN